MTTEQIQDAVRKNVVNSRLAIDGGKPVRSRMLPYGCQVIDDNDIAAVVNVLRSQWLTTGPAVRAFEDAFAATVGARHAVAVSNGTAALHAAIFAAEISAGDHVVTTPMTFAASANAVLYQGGEVRFVDVDPETLNIDADAAAVAMTRRTKAIVAVDFTGQPADLDRLLSVARANGALLIEDAAHALGATFQGRSVGSIADLTTFSFHPVKHITTAEGGVITTDDDRLAERLRLFRNHGISSDFRERETRGSWFYEMVELGFNYRLTDIQSALGLSQLGKLKKWLARRHEIARRYTNAFHSCFAIEVPVVRADRETAWHLYVVRLQLDRLSVGREQIFKALRAENIGVNVHYIPVPWHPYYRARGFQKGSWPVAEAAYERIMSLPMWAGMRDQDVEDTVTAVKKVVEAYAQ